MSFFGMGCRLGINPSLIGEPKGMIRKRLDDRRVELNMTPMIDVVFQLLAFFVLTFTVVAREGDFDVEARGLPPTVVEPDVVVELPERVVLESGVTGTLTGVAFRSTRYADVAKFVAAITALSRKNREAFASTFVFEIVSDGQLKYEHVIAVMDVLEPIAKRITLTVRRQ
jgi:biopolymer transport protein ExbD